MKAIACLVALGCLVGCQTIDYSNVYRVGIDPALDNAYQEDIVQALEEWETKAGTHQLHFVVSIGSCDRSDGPHLICYQPGSNEWFTQNDPGGHIGLTSTGYGTSSSNVTLKVAALQDPILRAQTIRHETGHALGLVHTNELTPPQPSDQVAIMCGNENCAAQHVTCLDIKQFMSYRHYPWGPKDDFCQDPTEPAVKHLQWVDSTNWD